MTRMPQIESMRVPEVMHKQPVSVKMPEPLTCDNGHSLVLNPKNQDNRTCDSCSEPIGKNFFANCNRGVETCDYDLCMRCAACPNGHLLLLYSGIPQCYLDKFPSATNLNLNCDKCKKPASIRKFFRCHADCDFDVCLACGPKKVEAKPVCMKP